MSENGQTFSTQCSTQNLEQLVKLSQKKHTFRTIGLVYERCFHARPFEMGQINLCKVVGKRPSSQCLILDNQGYFPANIVELPLEVTLALKEVNFKKPCCVIISTMKYFWECYDFKSYSESPVIIHQ